MNLNFRTTLLKAAVVACLLTGSLLPVTSNAQFSLGTTPPFLSLAATPNVMMTLDDSGSMAWSYVPDSMSSNANKLAFGAASYNGLAYDPSKTYTPPVRGDGVTYSTSFTTAYVNGFDPSKGSIDLSATGYQTPNTCAPQTAASSCTYNNANTAITTTTTVPGTTTAYTYTGCAITFTHSNGSNGDKLTVTGNCSPSMPSSGTGAPPANSTITIASSSNNTYNKSYTISSVTNSSGVRMTLSPTGQIPTTSSVNVTGATVSFSITSSPVVTTTSRTPAAFYTMYYGDVSGAAVPTGCNSNRGTDACYMIMEVGTSRDITAGSTSAQQQNFANWFSFYRTRALLAVSAGVKAVASLDPNQVRFGWQTINGCTSFGTSCRDYNSGNHENRLRTLDAYKTGSTTTTHRTDFFDWITRMSVANSTALRSAVKRVGEFYKLSGVNSAYAQDPYVSQGLELTCRRNFHIVITDGMWNGDSAAFGGDVDSTTRTLPDGTTYTPVAPFKSGPGTAPSGLSWGDNIADIQFNYWATDLRSDLANQVPKSITDPSGSDSQIYWNPKNDPATWQHMVNFNIGLGLKNNLVDPAWGGSTYAGDYSAIKAGTKIWPATDATGSQDLPAAVYDLWHGAINSRGQFFSAEDPYSLQVALDSVFSSIAATTASSASLAANSTSLKTGTKVFQARFMTADWSGQLLSFGVLPNGQLNSLYDWDSSIVMNSVTPTNRVMLTYNPVATAGAVTSGGKPLRWANITSQQQTSLNTLNSVNDGYGSSRLDWIRGDHTNESAGLNFKTRSRTVLGAIVNSNPKLVSVPRAGYSDSTYLSFMSANVNRQPVIYVGSSDGMLHAFNATSGQEMLAYLPSKLIPTMSYRSVAGADHIYGVDGSPESADVYVNSNWKTYLAGGLGLGGQGVYVLDVTSPSTFSESNASSIAVAEFNDSNDANLGNVLGKVNFVKMNNNKWAMVFGGGLNATAADGSVGNGKGSIFVLYLDRTPGSTSWVRGTDYIRIDVPGGTAAAPVGVTNVIPVDLNSDGKVDYIYAGDSAGKLWKIDVTSGTDSSWAVGNGGNYMFQAVDSSGTAQPILNGGLEVIKNPSGGRVILFGTGYFLSNGDASNLAVQSLYGILDNDTAGTITRSNLQSQSILAEATVGTSIYRETTTNSVSASQRGWYMDLIMNNTAKGERVIFRPLVRNTRVIFTTMLPSDNPCEGGGQSWVMELDAYSGGRLGVSPFDTNSDGVFTTADAVTFGSTSAIVSGRKSDIGISPQPAIIVDSSAANREYKIMSGSTGQTESVRESSDSKIGRLTWREVAR